MLLRKCALPVGAPHPNFFNVHNLRRLSMASAGIPASSRVQSIAGQGHDRPPPSSTCLTSSRVRRHVAHNYTWDPENGIVFSKCRYSSRASCAQGKHLRKRKRISLNEFASNIKMTLNTADQDNFLTFGRVGSFCSDKSDSILHISCPPTWMASPLSLKHKREAALHKFETTPPSPGSKKEWGISEEEGEIMVEGITHEVALLHSRHLPYTVRFKQATASLNPTSVSASNVDCILIQWSRRPDNPIMKEKAPLDRARLGKAIDEQLRYEQLWKTRRQLLRNSRLQAVVHFPDKIRTRWNNSHHQIRMVPNTRKGVKTQRTSLISSRPSKATRTTKIDETRKSSSPYSMPATPAPLCLGSRDENAAQQLANGGVRYAIRRSGTGSIFTRLGEIPSQGRLRLSPSPRLSAPHSAPVLKDSKSLVDSEEVDGQEVSNKHDIPNQLEDNPGQGEPKEPELLGQLHSIASNGVTTCPGGECELPLSLTTNLLNEDVNEYSGGDTKVLAKSGNTSNNEGEPHKDNTSTGAGSQIASISDMNEASESEHSSDGEQGSKFLGDTEPESETEDTQEQHVPLTYQIPPGVLRAAMQASPNSDGGYYRYNFYRGPNDQHVSTHYCQSFQVAERVAKYFVGEKVVGFDIEWKPRATAKGGIKENVSLIQLACEDRIALFHLAMYKGTTPTELVPPTLRAILEDPNICKVGVAVKGDFNRLETWLGIKARGQFELSRLHNLVEFHTTEPSRVNNKLVSLAKQVEQHLQLPLFKGKVRESDWSEPVRLTREQITYAATDAYAGFRIYDILDAKRMLLRPTPPRPSCVEHDPLVAKRVKAVPKAIDVPKEDEMEDDEYETAAEDFAKEEVSSEIESSSEYSGQSDGPDADYALLTGGIERPFINPDHTNGAADSHVPLTGRVGCIRLAGLAGPDPAYPMLPEIPSSEEGIESDSSSVFETPPKRLGRRITQNIGPGPPSGGPDAAALSMDIGTEVSTHHEVDHTTEKPEKKTPRKTTSRARNLGVRPIFQQFENRERTNSITANAGKDEKKRETKPITDTAVPHQPQDSAANNPPEPSSESLPTFTPLEPIAASKSLEYTLADTWASEHVSSTIPSPSSSMSISPLARIHATVPHLRAYHLWHHQRLPLSEIAKHLRDPPLAQSTVSSYILQAVTLERLDSRAEDLRVLLRGLPDCLRKGRFRWLVERVGGFDE
ncbi:uncharacterized protein BDR25DRAFT_279838 [Lindgomyces ingoldianus]|uniref:Uncharacterized protein n=1 Tax=Lindgomyces ingoldianus TaxID=673940 RepID=A0ACB6R7L9_9PLEO|nr:uncharacterized protein BDR25DRAFT_279838 [Lindgomyces ingoldianus]KAF2474522.1 hypothetical protein BDR25DRAFT_279838 [Lindgomyces ingoldianus]